MSIAVSHCSCTALMFNLSFGSSPLQRSCKTVDVREPHEVSFLRLVLTLIHCKQYSAGFPHRVLPALRSVWIKVGFQRNPVFSLFTLHPVPFSYATSSIGMLHWIFSYIALHFTRQDMGDVSCVLSTHDPNFFSPRLYLKCYFTHTETNKKCESFAEA